ncbi:MAG: hypothetical protein LBM98_09700 [Oscillospiraceae bacterium]|jgi:hypothetical protein|nr:hypothetical protein [Oscillospiraceae bacterium]
MKPKKPKITEAEYADKRKKARLFFIIVTVLVFFYGLNRSLGNEYAKVNDVFFYGVHNTAESPYHQLENKCKAANNLANRYQDEIPETSLLRDYRRALLARLEAPEPDISALYDAMNDLDEAFYAISFPNDPDAQNYAKADKMLRTGNLYNEALTKFKRETLSVFPTSFLRYLVFANPPEEFRSQLSNIKYQRRRFGRGLRPAGYAGTAHRHCEPREAIQAQYPRPTNVIIHYSIFIVNYYKSRRSAPSLRSTGTLAIRTRLQVRSNPVPGGQLTSYVSQTTTSTLDCFAAYH